MNVGETLPGFIGYRSTRSVVRMAIDPLSPTPAKNKTTSGAAKLVAESTTQPHAAISLAPMFHVVLKYAAELVLDLSLLSSV